VSAGRVVSRKKSPVLLKFVVAVVVIGSLCLLTSGYMPAAGNKDTFCISCHVMQPFRESWQASVHGGKNRAGVVVQCVQCHLPHSDIFRFTAGKIYQGLRLTFRNFSIDGKIFDWSGNADRRRKIFTHDSGCIACHSRIFPGRISGKGIVAHRRYLAEENRHSCIDCHVGVGHHQPMAAAENFFRGQSAVVRRIADDD